MRSPGPPFREPKPERRSQHMTPRPLFLLAALSLLPLAAACGGSEAPCAGEACRPGDANVPSARTDGGGAAFRGDASATPTWGGWAWGNVPADAAARAGFDWFETGYPGDAATNRVLAAAGVRPF